MPNEKIGRYEISSMIGRGGMATVYRAYDPEQNREVAIKVLAHEYLNDLGFRARFEREAQTITRLEHPAIVPVYEFGHHESQLYIVMKYMENGSLADRLMQGTLSTEPTAVIVKRVSTALDYAHSLGFVHRDLKPSNILFDENDSAFLADFGIALQTSVTAQERVVLSGTPAYMSPEQARREIEIDGRSDLYSLGITVFEMLTGRVPFDGDTPMVILLKHTVDSPPSVREINPELPAALEPFFYKILAKQPAERFQTGAAFTEAYYRACELDYLAETSAEGPTLMVDGQISVEDKVNRAATSDRMESIWPPVPGGGPAADTGPVVAGERESFLNSMARWLGDRPVVAFILVSLLGILSAALAVSLIRAPELLSSKGIPETERASAVPQTQGDAEPGDNVRSTNVAPGAGATREPNTMLVYTDGAVTLINISDGPLLLDNVTFRRVSGEGTREATFSASVWDRFSDQSGGTLPGGDCFQLLRSVDESPDARPSPLLPPNCETLEGWLVASDEEWAFWMVDGDGGDFQILQGDQIVQTCSLSDSLCRFYLPQP